jgi:hypothetical protein
MPNPKVNNGAKIMRKDILIEGLAGGFFGAGFILSLGDRDPRVIGGYILMAASLISACILKAIKELKPYRAQQHEQQ